MKRILYILTAVSFSLFALTSCEDYDFEESQGFKLQQLPKYVAFNGTGATVTLDTIDVDEDDDPFEINVEAPTYVRSDITVTYTVSGSAVYGVDYTVTGGSSTGGTINIATPTADQLTVFANGDIEVTPLTDGVTDGEKIVTFTLVSAVDADGQTFAIGRGEFLKTATVRITDID